MHLLALKYFYVSDLGGMRCLFAGAEMKRLTLAAMKDPGPDHPLLRPKVKSAAFEHLGPGVALRDKTKRLFSVVDLPQTLLAMDPFQCDEEDTFQRPCASSTQLVGSR